jgi:S-adenosylmethionine synthetase
MMDMYQAVLSEEKARAFVDQIFTKFDIDNSGEIDFKVGQASYPISFIFDLNEPE